MNKDLLAIFDEKAWNKKKSFNSFIMMSASPGTKLYVSMKHPKKLVIKQFFKKKKETTFRVATQLIT